MKGRALFTLFGTLLVLLSITLISASTCIATWEDDLSQLLIETDDIKSEKLLTRIISESPNWQEVAAFIQNQIYDVPPETGVCIQSDIQCADGVDRPFVTFIPSGYNASETTPLLVYLHGGVSREDLIEDPMGYATENYFLQLAEKAGWLVVFPFGQSGATWWDDVGMQMIFSCIRKTKIQFNVDDDRIWMTGFSDGASASYLFSMLHPTPFAAFVPLNGHMGVGSLDGKLPLYVSNMSVTPLYVINTDIDPLYPGDAMRPMVDMARANGADILYREYHGIGHDFDYWPAESSKIRYFLERHPRNPFPSRLLWKTALPEFGRCHWLSIDRITADDAASWHTEANLVLKHTRVSFGFYPDDKYEDTGVKIGTLVEGETLAKKLGLEAGDIIVKCNAVKIKTLDDLDAFKAGCKRGDPITVTVKREGEEITCKGKIPEPVTYYLFPREQPSGALKADFRSNRVSIESSRVGKFTFFIHPDMVQLKQKVVIEVNGKTVFDNMVLPNVHFMIRSYLDNRDRQSLFVSQIEINLEE
jgi:predicted esterase